LLLTAGPTDNTPPSTPSDLNATAQNDNQIDLIWQASSDPESGISKYNIYRDGANIGQSTTTSFSDIGLTVNTTYTYEVSAVNVRGLESAKSSPVSATTLADTIQPTITSVTISDSTHVIVVFSEPVEEGSATNVSSYSINNGIAVSNAWLGLDFKTVILTTSPHTEGVSYTLTVNNIQDLAIPRNVITSNTTVNYAFEAQLIINNLTVASGLNYEIVENGLTNGALVYIDRSYTYISVPSSLQSTTYIKTANNDKGSTGASFLGFDVNQDVTVYVAYDDRITTKPSWMASFTDTGDNLVTTDTTLSLFSKDYSAGTITLGGNEDSGYSMYTVIIVGQGGNGGTNQTPNAVIDTPVGDQTINAGDSVNFTGTGTDPDNNLPLTYLWGFGDPAIADSAVEDPGLVQFNNPGTYVVTFTVTDSLGLSDPTPDTRTITVQSSSGIPLVINNLTVASSGNYEIIENGLQNGALVYIDRSFTYTAAPSLLQGATYIKTANDDKGSSDPSFLTFEVNQDVTVYVAHDDRITTKPSWMVSFTDTGDDLVTTDSILSIFAKDFPPGTITLGGNEGSGNSMYTVVIIGQGSSSTPPDTIPPSSPTGLTIE
jgi:fibronectin type 3 domain-containing protein